MPFGVYLPAGKFRFGHLPGGHAVPVNLHAALRARRQGQQLRIFRDGEPVQHQRVAAVLPLEEQHMVFAIGHAVGEVKYLCAAFQQHGGFHPVDDDAQPIFIKRVDIFDKHAQNAPRDAKFHLRTDVDEERRVGVAVVDAPCVANRRVGRANQPFILIYLYVHSASSCQTFGIASMYAASALAISAASFART